MTYAEDKSNTKVEKLRPAEQVKYEIHNAVKDALRHSKTWRQFNDSLAKLGVKLEFVKRSRDIKSVNDIQGIRFTKDGLTFKASQISRDFCFARLNARLSWNTSESGHGLDSKKQIQEQTAYNQSNTDLIESNGLGLLSSFGESSLEERIPYDELLRRRKKKKRKGLGL